MDTVSKSMVLAHEEMTALEFRARLAAAGIRSCMRTITGPQGRVIEGISAHSGDIVNVFAAENSPLPNALKVLLAGAGEDVLPKGTVQLGEHTVFDLRECVFAWSVGYLVAAEIDKDSFLTLLWAARRAWNGSAN